MTQVSLAAFLIAACSLTAMAIGFALWCIETAWRIQNQMRHKERDLKRQRFRLNCEQVGWRALNKAQRTNNMGGDYLDR